MEECSLISTPMVIGSKLSKDDESPRVNQTMHSSIIDSPLYLIASQLDIMQFVGVVTRYQSTPK